MRRRSGIVLCAVAWTGAAAFADEIRTSRSKYPSIRIEDVGDGKLVFRDSQARVLTRSLADVTGLTITGWEAFNRAEASLEAGQYRQARRDYESLLRDVEKAGPDAGRPKHRRELVQARLLVAADREGHFDRAVECFIALCREWGDAAAGLEPRNTPTAESAFYSAAMRQLDAAIAEMGSSPGSGVLRRFRDRLTARAAGDPAVPGASTSAPTEPAPPTARGDARMDAMAGYIDKRQFDHAEAAIRDAFRREPPERLAPWYYWEGRRLEALAADRTERMRAAIAYMRVPVHYPDDPRCAECLYRTAMLHRTMGLEDRVATLLKEALTRNPDEELRRACESALAAATADTRPSPDGSGR